MKSRIPSAKHHVKEETSDNDRKKRQKQIKRIKRVKTKHKGRTDDEGFMDDETHWHFRKCIVDNKSLKSVEGKKPRVKTNRKVPDFRK